MRRSRRLRNRPPSAGRTRRSAEKSHKGERRKGLSPPSKSAPSSSAEWHSEEEPSDSATSVDNHDDRGGSDDDDLPVAEPKPPLGNPKPKVSVQTQYVGFGHQTTPIRTGRKRAHRRAQSSGECDSPHVWWLIIRFSSARQVYLRRLDECVKIA